MYGDTAPSQILWRTQLAALESGISRRDIEGALQRLDERLARISALADSAPALVHDTVRDVREQLDASWPEMMRSIRTERMQLSAAVQTEREAAMKALDAQRAAVTADVARIANQLIADAGEQVRRAVREALLLVIVLAVVILGLPFTAGYLVGRARRKS